MDSARRQVMFALNDYLAGIALDQLSNERRSAAFRSLPAPQRINGQCQRLYPASSGAVQRSVAGYFSYTPTEEQLEQAKSRMRR